MSNGNNNGDGDSDNDDDPLSGYKLCGYFIPILTVVSHSQTLTLIPGSPISLSDLGFRSDSGISLLPITNPNPNPDNNTDVDTPSPSKRKRRRKSGLVVVNGSVSASVVHQLHALVSGGCFKIRARVLRVSVREESARAAVLVDVYLPVEAWTGWQFPRARAVVVSFFKHVSCDWETRSSFLVLNENATHIDDERIWSCYDCHVFGCVLHCNSSGSGDKRSFDLPEIFKSLPTAGMAGTIPSTRIKPDKASSISPGIWDIADDVLTKILMMLGPRDLFSVSATCHHLRALTASVMPCMKLKLFPHQEAAVEWMLRREHNTEVLSHPLYMSSVTEDGLPLFLNVVSGELSTGVAPTVNDFRGGMFCDEPGLGKTITALSLILKTYGTLAEPPQGVDVVWCMRDANRGCGYYELSADNLISHNFMSTWKRLMSQNVRRGQACSSESTPELSSGGISKSSSQSISMSPELSMNSIAHSVPNCKSAPHMPVTRILRCTRSSSLVQRNLLDTYGKTTDSNSGFVESDDIPRSKSNAKRRRKNNVASSNSSETWVQCDACRKWRKLCEKRIIDASAAWFCRMNIDSLHQSCASPEEAWNKKRKITFLPGFYVKGSPQGSKENISFFTGVLKENITLLDSETRKALTWLANLSHNKLVEMETVGLRRPVVLDAQILSDEGAYGYHKIFRAFGLVRKVERGTSRWFYPSTLDNLELDLTALRIALTYPLDSLRLYLSRATLIVVPANLVDHWKTQIQEHVSPGQLRVYIWADHRKPDAHNLAWDYDIVITTFSRLSAEWGLRKRSVLMQIHWIRVMLDEGHTLGSSLSLTNKLQMAISLTATNRWILTGTPTPDTPNSQVAYLQPMLKFLHEEAYGQNQESWEAGILKPFEDQMEEGRSRLLDLLRRIMTCARKEDLRNIPPCVKKATYLHFTEEHAKSYNELVVTVRRNILMADWNDPSHVESLLNPKQWKFRSKTIRNVRLSCCVAGHIKVTDAGQDIQETMDLLVQEGLDPLSEEHAIIRISLLDGCSCVRCKNWCRLPVITPCRHLLCLDCVALDSEKCTYPGCGNPYEMQAPEVLTRPENPNPKWPVPKDLIELQPSYEQDDWNPDWQSTSSSKVAYLVKKLKDLQEPNNKIQSRNIGLHTEINDYSLLEDNGSEIMTNVHSSKLLPDKVIIFSQFLEHIHVIEQQLTFAGIRFAGMYNPMPSNLKKKSLMIFQNDPNCMVLLMDGSAALGLDLSFVTHVFLMEPIWDRSMEEQVISRAHRMGATRPIHVETLVMHGTIEEQMVDFLQDIAMSKQTLNQEIYGTNNEGARAYRTLHDFAENNYLSQLTFVRTNAA